MSTTPHEYMVNSFAEMAEATHPDHNAPIVAVVVLAVLADGTNLMQCLGNKRVAISHTKKALKILEKAKPQPQPQPQPYN